MYVYNNFFSIVKVQKNRELHRGTQLVYNIILLNNFHEGVSGR